VTIPWHLKLTNGTAIWRTHSESAANEPYAYSYLFAYTIDLPAIPNSLMLPNNPHIRILVASVSDESSSVTPVQPLYDTLDRANVDISRWQVTKGSVAP